MPVRNNTSFMKEVNVGVELKISHYYYVPHQVTIKNTQFQDHLLYQLYIQETSNM